MVGAQGARYAGTRAANIARSPDEAAEALERRHLEAAEQMVQTLGRMKGAAMKIGQLASFIDTEFLPPEYRELYQSELATLRTSAPPMPWSKVRAVLEEEWEEPVEELFADFEHDTAAAASIGQVHRAVLCDGRRVAVKIQYPGVAEAIAADMQNAGLILRMAKALAPGLDAKAAAAELKERVMEELDYELEAQNQRSFARAYRGHPFVYVPDVVTSHTRERVLVTELVDGLGFEEVKRLDAEARCRFGEIVYRFCFGSIYHLQHFNADAHPGNYLLMPDGRVAFLDFGMTKRLERRQIELEVRAIEAVIDDDPEELRAAAGFSRAKVAYLRSLAEHVLSGELELDRLPDLPDGEVIRELTAVKGIGEWSAHMFLMFQLQRPDVLAVGDLGIRRAVQRAYGLEELPEATALERLAEPWRPHRSLACLYLWRSLDATPA